MMENGDEADVFTTIEMLVERARYRLQLGPISGPSLRGLTKPEPSKGHQSLPQPRFRQGFPPNVVPLSRGRKYRDRRDVAKLEAQPSSEAHPQ